MADNVIPFPDQAQPASEQRPDLEDTITFTAGQLRPLTTTHPAMPMPRQSSGFDQVPWTDLVTRNFDGRG